MSDRKKPGVAFWATVVVLVALVGYPLSLGPACWLASRTNVGSQFVSALYRPITWSMFGHGNCGIGSALVRYSKLCIPDGDCWDWFGNPDVGWEWEPCVFAPSL